MRRVVERIAADVEHRQARPGGQGQPRDRVDRHDANRIGGHEAVGVVAELDAEHGARSRVDAQTLPGSTSGDGASRRELLVDPHRAGLFGVAAATLPPG